jgi:hypothetical protein
VKPQPKFIKKAKETYAYHRDKLMSNDKWTTVMTAKLLRRSLGSVSEDLLIARWCRTHEKQLEGFLFTYEALDWIREKQKEKEKEEIE